MTTHDDGNPSDAPDARDDDAATRVTGWDRASVVLAYARARRAAKVHWYPTRAAAHAYNVARCDPPLSEAEVNDLVNRAFDV